MRRCENCGGQIRSNLLGPGWVHHETGLQVCIPRPPDKPRPCVATPEEDLESPENRAFQESPESKVERP